MSFVDKHEFLRGYRHFIATWFNDTEFIDNPSIKVARKERALEDFLKFYTPWWNDENGKEVHAIEAVLLDTSIRPLRVAEAAKFPLRWDTGKTVQLGKLRPILIATDTTLNKTLVIDSNKTLCRLIYKDKHPLDTKIATLEIIGPNLQKLNGDFEALHQRFDLNSP